MILCWALISTLLLSSFGLPEKRTYDTHDYYVFRHDPTNPLGATISEVVQALGVELVERAGELEDHWLVRRIKPTGSLAARDSTDPVLSTYQELKNRALNTPLSARSDDGHLARRVSSSVDFLQRQTLRRRVKRAPPPPPPESSTNTQSKVIADHFDIRDPEFSKQWHIVNDEFPEHMMNVTGLWDIGLTGKGIITSFIDDGLDYTSDDLASRFVSLLVLFI